MKQQLIIVAVVNNSKGTWYFNAENNAFDNADNYSISDNPEKYSITNTDAMWELYNKEFDGMPNVEIEVYDTTTNRFWN